MDRRTFIVTVVSILLAATRGNAIAQQAPGTWRIGLLGIAPTTDPAIARIYETFWETLRERGYVEGKNLVVDRRFAERNEQFPALAAEMVRLKGDVIVTNS